MTINVAEGLIECFILTFINITYVGKNCYICSMTQNRYSNAMTEDLRNAMEVLRRGGVILYPTDTVWGIGCDASCSEAVRRIYSIKQRPDSKALITLVASEAMLERSVEEVPEVAWQLIDVAVEPLTVVYDRGCGVAPELLAPDGSIGIRLVKDCLAAELCRRLGRPLVSTSANKAGDSTPMCFGEISADVLDAVDYVCVSGRQAPPSAKASSVIKLGCDGTVKILRK